MKFSDLLDNIATMARQTAGRVRTLNSGIGVLGSAAEQWDDQRQHYRLPNVTEFIATVRTGLGRPYELYPSRRQLTDAEARRLAQVASQSIRHVRRQNPQLT